MPLSAVDAISPAFEHARQQLTKPFRANQWAKLGLVGLLAGEMSSGGGGCNPGSFQMPHPNHSQRFLELPFPSAMFTAFELGKADTDMSGAAQVPEFGALLCALPTWSPCMWLTRTMSILPSRGSLGPATVRPGS